MAIPRGGGGGKGARTASRGGGGGGSSLLDQATASRAVKGAEVQRIMGMARRVDDRLRAARPAGFARTPGERRTESLRRDAMAQAQRLLNPADQVIDRQGAARLRTLVGQYQQSRRTR